MLPTREGAAVLMTRPSRYGTSPITSGSCTDSIVNLQTLTTYVREFTNGAHKQNVFGPSASDDARISPRNAAINGVAVPLPNPIPHSSGCSAMAPRQAPAQAGHHMPAPAARPPPGAGIFAGLHSYPGDLVDLNGGLQWGSI